MSDVWYPRYVGDYQRKTGHLSMMEHGAYALLLDHYYSTGGLPANAEQLHRICRALAGDEQAAVQRVVAQFFERAGDSLINKKAEEQLAKRRDVSEKRSRAASAKHAKACANAGANAGAEAPTIPQPQPYKTPEESKASSGGARKRACRLPEGWQLSDEDRAYARSHGLSPDQVERASERFANYWHAKSGKDATKLDWPATWRNWVLKEAESLPRAAASPAKPAPTSTQVLDNLERAFRSRGDLRTDLLTAEAVEGLIARKVFTREFAASRNWPLAAAPIRKPEDAA